MDSNIVIKLKDNLRNDFQINKRLTVAISSFTAFVKCGFTKALSEASAAFPYPPAGAARRSPPRLPGRPGAARGRGWSRPPCAPHFRKHVGLRGAGARLSSRGKWRRRRWAPPQGGAVPARRGGGRDGEAQPQREGARDAGSSAVPDGAVPEGEAAQHVREGGRECRRGSGRAARPPGLGARPGPRVLVFRTETHRSGVSTLTVAGITDAPPRPGPLSPPRLPHGLPLIPSHRLPSAAADGSGSGSGSGSVLPGACPASQRRCVGHNVSAPCFQKGE